MKVDLKIIFATVNFLVLCRFLTKILLNKFYFWLSCSFTIFDDVCYVVNNLMIINYFARDVGP